MRLLRANIGAIAVGLVWLVATIGTVSLRYEAHAVQLFWLPTAIAVAALFAAPRERIVGVLGALIGANLIANYWFGLNFVGSIGYVAANISEPLIVVAIARRVIGQRKFDALGTRDMFLLFIAAFLGAITSALIAYPVRSDSSIVQFGWWVLSTSLGTSVCAPLLLYLYGRWRKGRLHALAQDFSWSFIAGQAGIFALSYWTLSLTGISLSPLILAALVFLVVRYGQLAASAGILLYGVAGTIQSVGGNSPAAYMQFDRFEVGIVLQAYMLLMLVTSFPLAALLTRHDRLSLRLKARNARMRENLLLLNMAEEVGRIGRWRYDPRSGAQDWSRQMFLINGMDPSRGPDPGDVKDLLPDGGDELFGQLANHAKDRARYSFEYTISPPRGEDRILRMYATNEFTEDGELASMFGVVMDVTEHHQRQEALDKERTRAMRLAAEAQYLAHTDPLTGLANRRRTITQLEKCVRRSVQDGREMALISFDIDHFKRINDTRGHQTGDEVLIRIAEIARGQARASDLIGRMGGEEFVWMLPGAGAEEARAAAERLRQAIEQESSEGGLPQVTASIGYALWREGDDANHLLARVDTALYEAKEAGRNKVQMAA